MVTWLGIGVNLTDFLGAFGDPDPAVGLTPERWEFLAISVLTIIGALSAIAVWLFSGGAE